ncbi:MAG TPA: hypothetical protein V6D00_01610 [Pantanalinema sp.]
MDGLIELIFEGVSDGAVDRLVYDLLQGVDILEISPSEFGIIGQTQINNDLMPLLKKEAAPASIFLRAAFATIGGVPIRSPLVRILRFEGSNEVAVVFGSANIDAGDRQDAVKRLAAGSSMLANSVGVSEYYCGIEPATDERTRLFYRDKIGPLDKV